MLFFEQILQLHIGATALGKSRTVRLTQGANQRVSVFLVDLSTPVAVPIIEAHFSLSHGVLLTNIHLCYHTRCGGSNCHCGVMFGPISQLSVTSGPLPVTN